uniref:Lipocalin n=1 Tax=Rhipicephalus zambeziensis TaxID=60191 RepID=A0A224YDU9_9ACAR
MTGLFNVPVGALLLIAAGQWCDANGNETTDQTVEQPSVDADCAPNNLFYQFWKDHNSTWTINATGDCKTCLHDSLEFINETVLELLCEYQNPGGCNVTFKRNWEYINNDTIVKDFGSIGTLYSQMLYKDPGNKCAVVREELWYRLLSEDTTVEEQCKNELRWDKLNITAEIRTKYRQEEKNFTDGGSATFYNCLPRHKLLAADGMQENVTRKCVNKYHEAINGTQRRNLMCYQEHC